MLMGVKNQQTSLGGHHPVGIVRVFLFPHIAVWENISCAESYLRLAVLIPLSNMGVMVFSPPKDVQMW